MKPGWREHVTQVTESPVCYPGLAMRLPMLIASRGSAKSSDAHCPGTALTTGATFYSVLKRYYDAY